MSVSRPGAVGIFDSGVGGLSVWRQIVARLPRESTLYIADQAHVPYGPRRARQLRSLCEAITDRLLAEGCKAVVVACNTASAVALHHLRERFPHTPIVGLEPAVKPAVARTRSGVVGVMATPATFAGRLYKATVGKHASSVRVVEQLCLGLADLVERADLSDPTTAAEAESMLRGFVEPMLAQGADTIVLGCTHYPFVLEPIRRLVGPDLTVIDPAPAVALQLERVLERHGLLASDNDPSHRFATSGDPVQFDRSARWLVGITAASSPLHWQAF
ncbi:MAG: glutamate racemase [Cyanobacteriota bacterium]|nr:glutamate racemase [Cyanobacteriota bacterium]